MFNLEKIIPAVLKKKALEVKAEVDKLTPEDTLELLENNKVSEVEKNGNTYSVKVYNDTPYAVHVEYGAKDGRKFGYHKPKGRLFYVGNGARMFGRTKEKVRGKIAKEIKSEILSRIK